jgi:hypothetical protein
MESVLLPGLPSKKTGTRPSGCPFSLPHSFPPFLFVHASVTRGRVLSTYGGLLRGRRNAFATRGGNGFRAVLWGAKRVARALRCGANRDKRGKRTCFTPGTRGRVAGRFWRVRVRRTHVLKNRNVGNSSAIFSRGGENAFWNGARRSHTSWLRGGTRVACKVPPSRATGREDGRGIGRAEHAYPARMLAPRAVQPSHLTRI